MLAEFLGEGQRVACRARQAVEPGHDEFIARAQDAPAQQVEFGPLAHARGLLDVDVALGAAGGDQVADLGLQPSFLVAGGGAGVADRRHALLLSVHLNEMAGIMLPILYLCIWQLLHGCAATAAWGWPCGTCGQPYRRSLAARRQSIEPKTKSGEKGGKNIGRRAAQKADPMQLLRPTRQ